MSDQPSFGVLLERFFTQRLMQQRRASTHTIASYRDTFKMLLQDFALCAHPVSSDWTHLAWVTGGAAEKEFYASLLREASFLALTPR